MKIISMIFVLLLIMGAVQGPTLHAAELTNVEAKRLSSEANQMINVARASTLLQFNATVESNGWKAPSLFSKWKVDVSTNWPKETVECCAAQREAGREIAVMLTRTSGGLLKETSSVDVEAIAKETIRFIEWMSRTDGYGNLLLLERAQNILAISLIRLTCDMEFPLDRIDFLVSKVSDDWFAPEKLYRVYRLEQPDRGVSIDYKSAFREWRELSQHMLEKHMKPDQYKTTEIPFGLDDVVAHIAINSYFPERVWDAKFHEKIFIGYDNQRLLSLKNLITFRREVGNFPANYSVQKSFDLTPISPAFRKAWDPYAFKKIHKSAWASVGDSAAGEYYSLITGMLMPASELEEWRSVHKERLGTAFPNMIKRADKAN